MPVRLQTLRLQRDSKHSIDSKPVFTVTRQNRRIHLQQNSPLAVQKQKNKPLYFEKDYAAAAFSEGLF